MVLLTLVTSLAAIVLAGPLDKRQADGSATLQQRTAFLCPAGIDATVPLAAAGVEAGLKFCSNIDRWSPATLYSSNPLNVGSGNYRAAASRCAALCNGPCLTFSVAPSTPGNATFGCNLYNATTPFRGNTNGGLFYAKQNIAGALPQTQTVTSTKTATFCPTVAVTPATSVITGPTNPSAITYPVVYHPAGQAVVTVTASNQVVTLTSTVTNTVTRTVDSAATTVTERVVQESAAPFIVFIGQRGEIKVTNIVNNIVTVIVVVINGNIAAPVTTTTTAAAAPTATVNSFQCPAGIVAQYQDTTNPSTVFNLRFCSNTQRWSPADLFSSTPISQATYASAAQACSERCNSTICQTFSIAPTTVGGSTYNCNLYNATNVFNGPTNGGLFYQRQPAATVDEQQASQCVGSLAAVSNGQTEITYSREFCSRTERWAPATLFDGSVQTGQTRGQAAPIVEAAQKCADRCASFGARCRTFSTTFTDQNPPLGDSAVPVDFNCNLYNATSRVLGNTQGGAFYLASFPMSNSTLMAKRFAHI